MKKILWIVIFLCSILLAGCSQQWSLVNDSFAKKQECVQYYDKIKNEAQNNIDNSHRIKEIFYSPILNSCLYQVEIMYPNTLSMDYDIWDYFAKKLIFTTNKIDKFENKVKELKWEKFFNFL